VKFSFSAFYLSIKVLISEPSLWSSWIIEDIFLLSKVILFGTTLNKSTLCDFQSDIRISLFYSFSSFMDLSSNPPNIFLDVTCSNLEASVMRPSSVIDSCICESRNSYYILWSVFFISSFYFLFIFKVCPSSFSSSMGLSLFQ